MFLQLNGVQSELKDLEDCLLLENENCQKAMDAFLARFSALKDKFVSWTEVNAKSSKEILMRVRQL